MPASKRPSGGSHVDWPEWDDAVKHLASSKVKDEDAAWTFTIAIVPTESNGNVRSAVDAARRRMATAIGKAAVEVDGVKVEPSDYIGSGATEIGPNETVTVLYRRSDSEALDAARKRMQARAARKSNAS